MATQAAGELAKGTCTLFHDRNWYAGSALLRQFIETEYLVWLFGDHPGEAEAWLTESDGRKRDRFRPGKLRQRAAGKFAHREYSTHCEMGGHPHPRGYGLLPDRFAARPLEGEQLEALLWLEAAVHFRRFWIAFEWTIDELNLDRIVAIDEARRTVAERTDSWFVSDAFGRDLLDKMDKAAAERMSDAD